MGKDAGSSLDLSGGLISSWVFCHLFVSLLTGNKHARNLVVESGFNIAVQTGYWFGSLSLSLEARHGVEVTTPVNPAFRLSAPLKIHLRTTWQIKSQSRWKNCETRMSSVARYKNTHFMRESLTVCSSADGMTWELPVDKWDPDDLVNVLLPPPSSPLPWLSTTFCNATISWSNKRAALFGTTTWKWNVSSIRSVSGSEGRNLTSFW